METDRITVDWAGPEKTIVLITYRKQDWTWQDFFHVIRKQREQIASVEHPVVDVIVDVRESNWLPKGGFLFGAIKRVQAERHPRQGITVIVGAKGLLASLTRMISRVRDAQKLDFHFVDTMDEAHALIAKIAASRQVAKSGA